MNALKRHNGAALALLLGAALALAGCSSASPESSPTPTDTATTDPVVTPTPTPTPSETTTPVESPTPSAEATVVTVTEKDFSIELSTETFSPGVYTFEVANGGSFTHNLNISGPGVDDASTASLSGGSTGSVTVTLQAGTYELWCSIGNHRSAGMDLTITVS